MRQRHTHMDIYMLNHRQDQLKLEETLSGGMSWVLSLLAA